MCFCQTKRAFQTNCVIYTKDILQISSHIEETDKPCVIILRIEKKNGDLYIMVKKKKHLQKKNFIYYHRQNEWE